MTHSTVVLKMCYLANRAMFLIFLLFQVTRIDAAEFFCPSGNVTCLIAAMNEANEIPGEHVISLEPGSYILQTVDNVSFGTAHWLTAD